MSENPNGDERTSGFIPKDGFITGQELAIRLGLRDHSNLQDTLAKMGVEHVSIAGKRLYRCADLAELDWEAND